jgi:hypothetical protein
MRHTKFFPIKRGTCLKVPAQWSFPLFYPQADFTPFHLPAALRQHVKATAGLLVAHTNADLSSVSDILLDQVLPN